MQTDTSIRRIFALVPFLYNSSQPGSAIDSPKGVAEVLLPASRRSVLLTVL